MSAPEKETATMQENRTDIVAEFLKSAEELKMTAPGYVVALTKNGSMSYYRWDARGGSMHLMAEKSVQPGFDWPIILMLVDATGRTAYGRQDHPDSETRINLFLASPSDLAGNGAELDDDRADHRPIDRPGRTGRGVRGVERRSRSAPWCGWRSNSAVARQRRVRFCYPCRYPPTDP